MSELLYGLGMAAGVWALVAICWTLDKAQYNRRLSQRQMRRVTQWERARLRREQYKGAVLTLPCDGCIMTRTMRKMHLPLPPAIYVLTTDSGISLRLDAN